MSCQNPLVSWEIARTTRARARVDVGHRTRRARRPASGHDRGGEAHDRAGGRACRRTQTARARRRRPPGGRAREEIARTEMHHYPECDLAKTVQEHVQNILRKLAVPDRSQAKFLRAPTVASGIRGSACGRPRCRSTRKTPRWRHNSARRSSSRRRFVPGSGGFVPEFARFVPARARFVPFPFLSLSAAPAALQHPRCCDCGSPRGACS